MKRNMLFLLMALAACWLPVFFSCTNGQQAGKMLYFSIINWQVNIPEGYLISDTMANSVKFDKGTTSRDGNYVYYPNNTLFAAERNKSTSIAATLIPYNDAKDGDWHSFVNANNTSFLANYKGTGLDIDTSSGTEILGGLVFERLNTNVRVLNKIVIQSVTLNRQFADHSLGIFIIYADLNLREQLLDIVRKSTFTKGAGK